MRVSEYRGVPDPGGAIGVNAGGQSRIEETTPHNGDINALAIFFYEPNITHWSAAPTRFLGWIGAFISDADEFAYRCDPGQPARGCPPSDRYTLHEPVLRRRHSKLSHLPGGSGIEALSRGSRRRASEGLPCAEGRAPCPRR